IRREDEIDVETNHLLRQTREPLDLPVRPSVRNDDVATLDIAQLAQAFPNRVELHSRLRRLQRTRHQHANPRNCPRLLGTASQWPCSRTAEQRDELAALHSITSSASASNVAGTSRPSALALLRLSTNSNLLDWVTGRSAGCSPLRIRAA